MTTEPHVESRTEQPYASIRTTAPLSEWGRVNALVPEVLEWLTARGITPVGAPFYRYHAVDPAGLIDVEVGWPVQDPVEGDGRVTAGARPAGDYAVLVHLGHPDRIREAFAALDDWSARTGTGFAVRDGVWAGRFETYLTHPDEVSDLGEWRTEVAYLLSTE